MAFAAFWLAAAGPFHAAAATPSAPSFAPLVEWTSAINHQDTQALQRIYAAPQADPARVAQEIAYWSAVKGSGITGLTPKVLSNEEMQGATVLVLRIYGVQGGHPVVSGMSQAWQKGAEGWRLVAWQRGSFQEDKGRKLPEPVKPNPALYPSPGEARDEIRSASRKQPSNISGFWWSSARTGATTAMF